MFQALLYSLAACLIAVFLRFVYLCRRNGVKQSDPSFLKRTRPCRTAVVLGSGGHTSEMMRIMEGINLKHYTPRLYVVASGDKMSLEKVRAFETSNNSTFEACKANGSCGTDSVLIKTIP